MVELKNNAEAMVYTTEKMLKDYAEKIPADQKKEVEEKLEALKKLKDSADKEAIKKAADELSTVAQKVGGAMYQQEQANAQQGAPQAGADHAANAGEQKKDDQGPIDAEFKEKK